MADVEDVCVDPNHTIVFYFIPSQTVSLHEAASSENRKENSVSEYSESLISRHFKKIQKSPSMSEIQILSSA